MLSQLEDISAFPTVGERIGYAGTVAAKLCGRVVNKLKGEPWKAPYLNPNSVELPVAYQRLVIAEKRAIRAYSPESYSGRVVLLKARQNKLGVKIDHALGWSSFAPSLEVITTPGTHFTILEEPCVRVSTGHIHDVLGVAVQ